MNIKPDNPLQMLPLISQENQYLIFDWSNLVHRAYYVAKGGNVLKLLYYMVNKQKKAYGAKNLVAATEGNGKQHRQAIFSAYKQNRKPNQEIEAIYPKSIELFKAMGCSWVIAPHGEADDAIGVFAARTADPNTPITIVSEDRDLWQLLCYPGVRIHTNRYGLVDKRNCSGIMGVEPRNVAVMKALLGDAADNVPRGVPRAKTKDLIAVAQMGTTPREAYMRAKEKQVVVPKVLEKIVKHKEDIERNFRIVRIRTDLKIVTEQHTRNSEELEQIIGGHVEDKS